MDFVKKNIGLLIFLVVCVGVVIYLVISIMGAQKLREENKAKRLKHLDEIKAVKDKRLRFDDENLAKAKKNAETAKATQDRLIHNLGEKMLLPGINFDVDPDEESSNDSSDGDDDADSTPKVDRYKNLPYRKVFDEWMKGSLFDARETLTNEIIKMNIIYFKLNDDDDDDDDVMNGNIGGGADAQGAVEKQPDKDENTADDAKADNAKADNAKADKQKNAAQKEKADDKPKDARAVAEAKKKAEEKEKAAAEKKVIEEKKAEMDAGKSTYQVEKEKRMKIIKDQSVPEYFMFNEYVFNRESGLRSKKEKRDCFRQLILLDAIIRILRKSEIKTLNSIDFPCGLEVIDGDKYKSTPVAITVTGKPECVEAFLNLLNANENYIFYLRDIVSFDATVQLNTDPMLAFNNAADSGSAALNNFLKSVGTTVGTTGGMDEGRGGGRMMDMGGDEGRGRRRRGRRGGDDMGGMMERGGMGRGGRGGMMMEDGMAQKAEQVIRTRKAYRIFADSVEESGRNEDGRNFGLGQSKSLEEGTSVTLSLNFEFVEFKVAE